MAKSSRWSQWVIAESSDPTFPMPWTIGARVRNGTQRARAGLPGSVLNGAVRSNAVQPAH